MDDVSLRGFPRAFLVAAVLLLAGCAGSPETTPEPAPEPVAPEPALPERYLLACPDGGPLPEGAPCAGALPTPERAAGEPYVAIDSHDPARMAVGVMEVGPEASGGEPAVSHRRVTVYTSADGGETWTFRPYPPVELPTPAPDGVRLDADPALVFDDAGVLHFTALAVQAVRAGGDGVNELAGDVFYLQSADLGETWTDPVLLTSDGVNDRQWIGAGPNGTLVVTWQPLGVAGAYATRAAWSLDGGATWTQPANLAPGCFTPSRPLVEPGTFLFACSEGGDVRFLRASIPSGDLHEAARLQGMACGTNLLDTFPDGRVLWACLGGHLATGDASAANWSEPAHVADLVPDAPGGAPIFWAAAAPSGNVHVLLDSRALAAGGRAGDRAPAHVTLATGPFDLLSHTQLTDVTAEGQAYTHGEFYGLAVQADAGLLAWPDAENRIRYAHLMPV